MRYSITLDAQLFRLVDRYLDSKVAVMDAIIHAAKGATCVVERTRSSPDDGAGDHVIMGNWHVFAHDGYHLVEVLRMVDK